jgi:hypothetical protein
MTTPNYQNLVSTRRSQWYYIDGIEEVALQQRVGREASGRYGFYSNRLSEGVGALLPYGDGFGATVVGANSDATSELVRFALAGDYDRDSLEGAIRTFFTQTAQCQVSPEPPTYEVDYLVEPGSPESGPVAFKLELLQPGSFDRLHGRDVQYVPRSLATTTTSAGLGYVELKPGRVFTFQLPSTTEKELGRTIRFLGATDLQQANDLTVLTRQVGIQTEYDFSAHRRTVDDLLLKATRPMGWTARAPHRADMLDPYAVWRQLRFKRFKAELRDTILEQLNAVLAIVGADMGFEGTIRLDGVFTISDLDAAEADLRDGRRTLTELVNLEG